MTSKAGMRRRLEPPFRFSGWWATVLATALLHVSPFTAARGQVPSPRVGSHLAAAIRGQILDRISGIGVPSAQVVVVALSAAHEEPVWEGTTGMDGRFAAMNLHAGAYEIQVRKTTFSTLRATLDLREGEDLTVDLEMFPDAIQLDPVIVWAHPTGLRGADGGRWSAGQVSRLSRLTRDRITALGAQRVSDLFYAIPGAKVLADPTGRGAAVVLRNGCNPQLVVDGVPFSYPVRIDEVLKVDEIETLEVFQGRSAAVRFSNSSCGTITAWTRRETSPRPEPVGWPKALGALVFFGGLIGISSLF